MHSGGPTPSSRDEIITHQRPADMIRNSSFFWASDDLSQDGDNSSHERLSRTHTRCTSDIVHPSPSVTAPLENAQLTKHLLFSYGSANDPNIALSEQTSRRKLFELSNDGRTHENSAVERKSIRFQVVIWHIGEINVQRGHLKMRFRITLFWDDTHFIDGTSPSKPQNSHGRVWVMEGRQNAYLKEFNHDHESTVRKVIDVPPVSILNAIELETVTPPEITMLNTIKRSMRWTCMYNATLSQGEDMSVKDFPHDNHLIKLKIGILAHRNTGGRWDRNIYTLGLAREEDSQGSTRTPHGLVVDHCHVPDFAFDKTSLLFEFIPLMYGGWNYSTKDRDVFLQVTLPVRRQSQHYDTSILPMLIMLNIIAITCLTRNFASATAATEIMLSIAFVQVGIRLTLDSRLPSVGYTIKMQKVMNCCFWLLSALVLESNVVFFLVTKMDWKTSATDRIDLAAAFVALLYNGYIVRTYFYRSAPNLCNGRLKNHE